MNAEKITSSSAEYEMSSGGEAPFRQIRAVYDDEVIRVYQAYSYSIAAAALQKGTFVSPPFKLDRMTWIKPSFLWMMYLACRTNSESNHAGLAQRSARPAAPAFQCRTLPYGSI
jgi:hypothetical protein